MLDALVEAGVRIDLDRSETKARLVVEPAPSPDLAALVDRYRAMLTYVALGRYTGHAVASCSACGWVTMLSVVNSSGTSRGAPSVGWPRCLDGRCAGRRVIRPVDALGVARVKHRAAPRSGVRAPRARRWRSTDEGA